MPKTSSPTSRPGARETSIAPLMSVPSTAGSSFGIRPRRNFHSIGLIATARTLIRTSPSAGSGGGSSSSASTSGSPVLRITAARIGPSLLAWLWPVTLAPRERSVAEQVRHRALDLIESAFHPRHARGGQPEHHPLDARLGVALEHIGLRRSAHHGASPANARCAGFCRHAPSIWTSAPRTTVG